MKYLLIDTATRFTHLAIGENHQILHSFSKQGLNFQSEEALPLVISLLEKAGLSLSSLDAVFIGVGPGSFTGTRVGVTIGKTIAFSCKIPCVPFCSLLCYEPSTDGDFSVITDAKNKKTYVLKGAKKGSEIVYNESPILLSYDDVSRLLSDNKENFLFIDPLPTCSSSASWQVNLEAAAQFAFRKWREGRTCKAQEVSVLYLRNQGDL